MNLIEVAKKFTAEEAAITYEEKLRPKGFRIEAPFEKALDTIPKSKPEPKTQSRNKTNKLS